jgi:hypothetical protein
VARTKGNQRLTLAVPARAASACAASAADLAVRLGAQTLAHGTKLKFASATFFVDRGVKRVRAAGRHRKVTSYVPNATIKRLPASPRLSLKGLTRGVHTLKVVVDLEQTVTNDMKRHGKLVRVTTTKTVTARLTSKFDVS